MILDDTIKIAGETINKERWGMASIHDENKTFTGNVLYKNQIKMMVLSFYGQNGKF